MEWAAKSDVGLVRKSNEDSFIVRITPDKPAIAVVADGMGGYKGGKVASSLTVDSIVEGIDQFYPEDRDLSSTEIEPTMIIKRAIKYANEKVYKLAQENPNLHGMGTTVVVALLADNELVIGHVGDSRAYMVSNNQIQQLTKDHTLVSELVNQGKISTEEALNHPQRNIITRALGTSPNIIVDIEKVSWIENSVLLMCTDGLSEVISSEEFLHTIIEQDTIAVAVDQLVAKSLEIGGKDNITLVAIKKTKPVDIHLEGVTNGE